MRIEAGLIQNIEDADLESILMIMHWFAEAKLRWTALLKHLKRGLLHTFCKHLPALKPQEFTDATRYLGIFQFRILETHETFYMPYWSAFKENVHQMKQYELIDCLMGFSYMKLRWPTLFKFDKEAIFQSIARNCTEYSMNEILDLFKALNRLNYQRHEKPIEIRRALIHLLKQFIQQVKNAAPAKEMWLCYTRMKFNEKDISIKLHFLLKLRAFPESAEKTLTELKIRTTRKPRKKSKHPKSHQSPKPYHDYNPRNQK